jgi:hypothetical protein
MSTTGRVLVKSGGQVVELSMTPTLTGNDSDVTRNAPRREKRQLTRNELREIFQDWTRKWQSAGGMLELVANDPDYPFSLVLVMHDEDYCQKHRNLHGSREQCEDCQKKLPEKVEAK